MKVHFTILCLLLLVACPAQANQDAVIPRLDVLMTIDSINPESSELTVMLNTHPPTADRLDKLAIKWTGEWSNMRQVRSMASDFSKLQVTAEIHGRIFSEHRP